MVPRIERGEAINAGVIVYSQAYLYLCARIQLEESRLLAVDGNHRLWCFVPELGLFAFENGHWMARKVSDSDKEFTPIPGPKVEHERDSPDGRSHLCGRRYGFTEGGLTVFCFVPGAGG